MTQLDAKAVSHGVGVHCVVGALWPNKPMQRTGCKHRFARFSPAADVRR